MLKFKVIGNIKPKRSADIKKSKIGLGFEKLDRDIFDPEDSYDFVAKSGIKWARLQSGWQKTERKEGVYDFEWLDKIVDKMLSMGVEPWLCLCYGNKLYTEAAEKVFGAVGCPPIKTERERTAWKNYVKATVTHFKGRIHYYEIWNEPDGQWCWKHGVNAQELGEFTIATADACKEADGTCETVGLVTCGTNEKFYEDFCRTSACEHLDAISYHCYRPEDELYTAFFNRFDRIRKNYNPKLKIIQGESGTQSRSDGCGAMAGGAWDETKQAKYLLRHLITDIALGVEFTSYFSCMDMAEALNGEVGNLQSVSDFGYFGVIGADFDENARATGNYHPKASYFALQTLTSVLCEDYERAEPCIVPVRQYCDAMQNPNFDFAAATHYAFKRDDGSMALIYWKPAEILTETYLGFTSFRVNPELAGNGVSLVDLADGTVYELDEKHMFIEDGWLRFKNIPITDSPLMLDFNNFYKEL